MEFYIKIRIKLKKRRKNMSENLSKETNNGKR